MAGGDVTDIPMRFGTNRKMFSPLFPGELDCVLSATWSGGTACIPAIPWRRAWRFIDTDEQVDAKLVFP